MRFLLALLLAAALVALGACTEDQLSGPDAGTGPDGQTPQVPPDAAQPGPDASVPPDASIPPDASVPPDAGPVIDGGPQLFGHELSPLVGSVVFNEVLMDGTTNGDPNGDGDADPVEDQFVELVSTSTTPLVMDGFTLVDRDMSALPRHTFGTFTLAGGKSVVVFGGGDAPASTSSATFFTANAADPGIPFGLHLKVDADYVLLLDPTGKLVAQFCYGNAEPLPECAQQPASDQSLTRSPDVTGNFTGHLAAAGAGGSAFSVGTKVDGNAF